MAIQRVVVVVHHVNEVLSNKVAGFVVQSGSTRKLRWVNGNGESSVDDPAVSETKFDVRSRIGLRLPEAWNQEQEVVMSAVAPDRVGWASHDLDSALAELAETYA